MGLTAQRPSVPARPSVLSERSQRRLPPASAPPAPSAPSTPSTPLSAVNAAPSAPSALPVSTLNALRALRPHCTLRALSALTPSAPALRAPGNPQHVACCNTMQCGLRNLSVYLTYVLVMFLQLLKSALCQIACRCRTPHLQSPRKLLFKGKFLKYG